MVIRKLRSLLVQPYPFYYEGAPFLKFLGLLICMAAAFNIFFEPFNVYHPEHRMPFAFISVIHGLVAGLALVICYFLAKLLPEHRANWTVGKEIIGLAVFLLITGIGQFLIRDLLYNNENNWSWAYFFEEVRNTYLVGSLIIALLLPVNYNWLYKRHQEMAASLNKGSRMDVTMAPVMIKTQLKGDDFFLDLSAFRYAKSEGNYVSFYIHSGDEVIRKLKRITINEAESQLAHLPFIFRTHRSYLINLLHIHSIRGNAQGFKLFMEGSEEVVPVSRAKLKDFETRMGKG